MNQVVNSALANSALANSALANSALANSALANSALANSALANWDKVQVIDLRNCHAFLFTRLHGKSLSEANLSILEKGYLAPLDADVTSGHTSSSTTNVKRSCQTRSPSRSQVMQVKNPGHTRRIPAKHQNGWGLWSRRTSNDTGSVSCCYAVWGIVDANDAFTYPNIFPTPVVRPFTLLLDRSADSRPRPIRR